jgi:hypothetical protein
MYDPSHDLVERQVTTTVVYDKGSRREILDVPSNAEPAEGDHLDLDVILASMAIAPNHGTAVHMSNGNVPRLLNTNNSLTAQVDFLDPWADIVVRRSLGRLLLGWVFSIHACGWLSPAPHRHDDCGASTTGRL